jgi:hypothetical protein
MTTEQGLEKREKARARGRAVVMVYLGVVTVVAIAALIVALLHGAGQDTVQAQKFVVVDAGGKRRAVLTVSESGPGLGLFDENGTVRAVLAISKHGSYVLWADERGKMRAMLRVGNDGPGLGLYDENGRQRAVLTVFKDGPALVLADENAPRAGLAVSKDGPGLTLLDENGEPIWSAPPSE